MTAQSARSARFVAGFRIRSAMDMATGAATVLFVVFQAGRAYERRK